MPVAMTMAAAILLPIGGAQYCAYQCNFLLEHRNAMHLEYGYNPPARLLALVLVGPASLAPHGFERAHPFGLVSYPKALAYVFVFWVVLLRLLKTRPGLSVIRKTAPIGVRLFVAAVIAFVSYQFITDGVRQSSMREWSQWWPLYGFSASLLVHYVAGAWMAMTSAILLGAAVRQATA